MNNRDTILIVDDQEINRAILSQIFIEKYQIVEAENGKVALEYIKKNKERIVAILLDIIMPEMDGMELLRILKKEELEENIPIFLITADTSQEKMREGYELGVNDIIEKPFVPFFLEKRIKSIIELYKTRERLNNIVEHQAEIIEEKVKDIKILSNTMLETLALAIEFRSGETGQHVQNIRKLTFKLLKKLKEENYEECVNLTNEDIENIANASILHDIGKIAIPDAILNKPGRFTPEEFEIMKTHSARGGEIIERIPCKEKRPLFRYAYDICRHHHERWNGKGYPDGLVGKENKIWAQVVALADVYDALISKRCYKDPYERQKAVDMIVNGECGEFNPELIKAFIEIEKEL